MKHRHTGVYYMAVTNDDLELPVFLAYTAVEMAAFLGVGISSMYSIVSRERNGRSPRKKRSFRVITFTDEEIGAPDDEEEDDEYGRGQEQRDEEYGSGASCGADHGDDPGGLPDDLPGRAGGRRRSCGP